MPSLTLPLFGFVVGFIVGLTGLGGAVLMTPLLLLGFNLPPALAVGTDLAYSLPTKIVGAVQHARLGNVSWRHVRRLALGSLPAAAAAVWFVAILQQSAAAHSDAWLRKAIGVTLIVACALLAYRAVRPGRPAVSAETGDGGVGTVLVGAIGGLLVGLTSVGSGSIIMALLVFAAPLAPRYLVGTDVVHAVLLVGVAGAGYAWLGQIDYGVAGAVLLGSLPGVWLGSRLTAKAPRRGLQLVLAVLLLVAGASLVV